jgi:rfaE bifunctional protein nucleotidyltransferase chain/domain
MSETEYAPILGREELAAWAAESRAAGRRIVLVNGCFDLLHPGHVRYLEAARREGDLLVLALNSDASVRRLKGEGRPVQSEEDRARLVAALEPVDRVHVFAEDDVEAVLRAVRPHVHAKGSEYTPETVPERHVAAEVGAEVRIVGGPKIRSTSGILDRVSSREE